MSSFINSLAICCFLITGPTSRSWGQNSTQETQVTGTNQTLTLHSINLTNRHTPILLAKSKKGNGIPRRAAERVGSGLVKYDRDRDGVLSSEEVARYMADKEAFRRAFVEKYDQNKDGRLSKEEHELAFKLGFPSGMKQAAQTNSATNK